MMLILSSKKDLLLHYTRKLVIEKENIGKSIRNENNFFYYSYTIVLWPVKVNRKVKITI